MNGRLVTVSLCVAALIAALFWWRSRTPDRLAQPDPSEHLSSSDAQSSESSAAANPLFDGLNPELEKFIWDAEHYTFELETHIGKRMIAAMKSRDPAAAAACLLPNFSGYTLNHDQARLLRQAGLKESIAVRDPSNDETDDADQFAEWLVKRLPTEADLNSAKFRVLHIRRDPAANDDPDDSAADDRWQLKVLVTQKAQQPDGTILFLEQNSTLLCRFSGDDQIANGQIVQQWTVDSESLRTGPPTTKEITAEADLKDLPIHDNWKTPDQPRQYNKQLAVADYNNDGFPDVAIATIDRQLILLQNKAGKFHDATEAAGLPAQLQAPSMLVTWLDYDNDGFADLLAGHTVFRNESGKSFRPVSQINVGVNPMGSAVADYDADGLLDLYVLHQHDPSAPPATDSSWLNDDQGGAPNQLWRNLGDGRFVEMTGRAGVAGGRRHSFAAVWFHANDDHYPDLYVANDFARNSFFVNRGDGTFEDVSESSNTADFATSMGVAAGDLNGDGHSELYVANMYSKMGRRILAQVSDDDYPPGTYAQLKGACAGNRLYRRTSESLTYEEVSDDVGINAVGWAYAPALTDFDMDGRLDIYATAGFLSFRRDKPDG